jgi:hypothetical protein
MNFISRWRHFAERNQEQLLVRLWTINSMDTDEHPQANKLALAAKVELRPSLKYLTVGEIESTVRSTLAETAYQHQVLSNLRRQIHHGRNTAGDPVCGSRKSS